MSKIGERVMVSIMAVLFLITSLGFSGLVIWEMHQQSRKDKALKQSSEQLNKENKPQEGKLVGTKLAGFEPGQKVEGLQKIDSKVGEGAEVKPTDKVTVHYTGALVSDGTIFDTSYDRGEPATFGLDQVIKGWTEGIPGMKVGGKRRLIIPAALAYGEQSKPGIPANSDLIFDVELVKIGE